MPIAIIALALAAAISDIAVPPGGSIQAAIDLASDGDRVLVSPGTYVENVDFRGKAIEVIGVAGALATTIDPSSIALPDCAVKFHQLEGPASKLSGFTVAGGRLFGPFHLGAGVSCRASILEPSATPVIADCIVRDNHAQQGARGGGIGGSPTLERCIVRDNRATTGDGGGIFGAPTLRHCALADNVAADGWGGGLYVDAGHARLEDCVVARNRSDFSGIGGGAYVQNGATLEAHRTLFWANAIDAGAHVAYGGAVYAEPAALVRLERCTIVGQQVKPSVLGVYGNGGVHGPFVLVNSILRDNGGSDVYAGITSISYSNVQGGAAGPGVIDAPPAYVDPVGGDWHLQAGSAGIDAGDPASPDPDGSPADMGAFPYQVLYTRANATPAELLDPSWPAISLQHGGKQVLRFAVGSASAGLPYLVAGTTSGASPGLSVLGALVPLNPDGYFSFTLSAPNTPPLSGSLGVLGPSGTADCSFALPAASAPALAGTLANHAAVSFQLVPSLAVVQVSNAEPLALVH